MNEARFGWRPAGRGVLLLSVLLAAPPLAAIEDIVVTTRKTAENLKDVPVAVTAFDSRSIEEARIESLDDVAALTPGLNFFSPIGQILPVPVIRGVAPTDIFGEPNAAVYLDGVFAAGREGLNFAVLEIERIEVNKGPQSALYGRNAFSGAINYVTKRPSSEFEASLDGTAGNDGKGTVKGMINLPLAGDVLALRVAAMFDAWDGSYDNPISSEDVGGYEYHTVIGDLYWTPTENFSALFKAYYSDDRIDGAAQTGQPANCENVGADNGPNQRLANLCGPVWSVDQNRAWVNAGLNNNPNVPESERFFTGSEEIPLIEGAWGEKREVTRLSLNLDWDLDFGTFTALTGYSKVEQESSEDGTRGLGYSQPFNYCTQVIGYIDDPANTVPLCADFLAPSRFGAGSLVVSPPAITEEISQEIRFSTPVDKAIRGSLGFYYFSNTRDEVTAALLARSPTAPPGAFDPTGPGTPPPGIAFGPWPGIGLAIGDPAFRPWFTPTSTLGRDEFFNRENDSWAVFGTGEVDLNDALTLDFQLRFTNEDRSLKVTAPQLGYQVRSASKSFDFVTGRIGVRYRVSDDWMVYGSVSNGTKAGGFDSDVVDVLTDPSDPNSAEERIVIVPFAEEKLLAYELGAKGFTSDGRFGLDLAMYMMDWSEIVIPQVFNFDPLTGDALSQPEGFNTNAGDATLWGWEIQGNWNVTDTLKAKFGLSFTDAQIDKAKLESFADFPSFSPDGDVSGNQVLREPPWQGNVTLIYERQLFGDWEGLGRLDVTYQDEYFGGVDNQWTIPSHTYVNLRAQLTSPSGRYTIALWTKNLLNDDSPIAGFRDVYFGNSHDVLRQLPASQSASPFNFFPWRINAVHPNLRTYGLSVKIRFGNAD
ncbi:MAG: hypothetical protein D6727_03115 [Gammaproteobacteria bacterium]|nr:MAG: hypothetical protein D6727_03115 [Gammaproteobacteria bacterium]